ncbi:MAG: sulfatase [Pseudomonadota bacterium]
MNKRPNIVYIFADQLRYDALGCTGSPVAKTPNIDRFAGQGTSLSNAIVNTPVCTAHRASLMTGKYTTSHGMVINELRIHPNQRCLGHVLTDAGYATAYIGKWHLYANELGYHYEARNSFVPRGPHRLGFDGEWKAYNFHHDNYSPPAYFHEETPEKIEYAPDTYEPTVQTDYAIDFIKRRTKSDDGRPFSLVLSYGPPHDPWEPDNVPKAYWDMFEGMEFPNPPNYRAANDEPYADNWAKLSVDDREQLGRWRRGYHAQVASIDDEIGRILGAIDEMGLFDDTIIVFTSDHGEMFGAQGRRAKLIFYDEAARVPYLLRWPGKIAAGSQQDLCFGSVDILPTLCGLASMPPPDGIEGNDLSEVLLGQAPIPEDNAVLLQGCGATAAWEDGHEWRALRDKTFTYAVYKIDGKEFLFNNETDPFQMHNLADDGQFDSIKTRMKAALWDRMDAINDEFQLSSWYRDNWTDQNRKIVRSATCEFGPPPD